MTTELPGGWAYFSFPTTPYVTTKMLSMGARAGAAWFVERYLVPAIDLDIGTIFLRERGRWDAAREQRFPVVGNQYAEAIEDCLAEATNLPRLVAYEALPAPDVFPTATIGGLIHQGMYFDADAWDASVGCSAWHKAMIAFLNGANGERPQLLEPEDDDGHPDQFKYPKIMAESFFNEPWGDWQRSAGPRDYCWFQGTPTPAGEDDRAHVVAGYSRFIEALCAPNQLMPVASLANCVDLGIALNVDGSVR